MKTLLKSGIEFKRLELPKLTNYSPCNPSIIVRDDGLLCLYRGCNYFLRQQGYKKFYGSWTLPMTDSQNYIADVSDDLECLRADLIEDRHSRARNDCLDGILDLRVFAWRGEIFAAGAGCNYRSYLEKKTPFPNHTMVLGKLSNNKLDIVTAFNSGRPTEKNWMPWVMEDELYFVYSPEPLIILSYDRQRNSLKDVSGKKDGRLSGCRGGSNMIPFGDNFIGIVHTKNVTNGKLIYRHRVVVASRDFAALRVSQDFSFEGEDVEFCAGLAIKNANIYFSYGVFDEAAVILRMPTDKATEFLFS